MANAAAYIFKKGSCLKKDLYKLILNELVAAGWKNVASHANDYDVLISKGKDGDKNLIINLRPIPAAGTIANNVTTSNFCQISYRLQSFYTPGTNGTAGVFGRPALAWTDLYLVPVSANGQLPLDTTINYKVYADCNKIIVALEYPTATGYNPVLFYIGQPDSSWVAESDSRGMLVATTCNAFTVSTLMVCNTPDGMGQVAVPYGMTTLAMQPLKNPNAGGRYFNSIICYQSATEGIRGQLDGIVSMLNSNVMTGDTVTIDECTYYALCCHMIGASSFPSQALLIRIE